MHLTVAVIRGWVAGWLAAMSADSLQNYDVEN